jgi:hypothetical protein
LTISLPQGRHLSTHSSDLCAKNCDRKFFYRYVMGVRRETDDRVQLRRGGAVHKGLELLAKGEHWLPAIQQLEGDDYELSLVHQMLMFYNHYWNDDLGADVNSNIAEYLAIELPFALPILNPKTGRPLTRKIDGKQIMNAGKIDGIVKLRDGRVALLEHKTASDDLEPGSPYWQRLTIDSQISRYWLAARTLGYDVQTVLYDVLRVPGQKPAEIPVLDSNGYKIVLDAQGNRVFTKDGKKPRETGSTADGYTVQVRVETPDEYGARIAADIASRPHEYYYRREIPRLQADLDEFALELWQQAQLIARQTRDGFWPRNTASCIQFRSACEYLGVCANGVDPNNLPSGFVQVPNVHPELAA